MSIGLNPSVGFYVLYFHEIFRGPETNRIPRVCCMFTSFFDAKDYELSISGLEENSILST